jgi:hypothetical protein
MSPSTAELFGEVARDILMKKDVITSRDFLEHPDLQEMNYKLCKTMVRNWLKGQVQLGKITKVDRDTYTTFEV